MTRSVRLLSKYAVNDVLSMRQLKTSNLRMLKYLESNFQQLSSLLSDEGITVLNDLKPVKEPAALQAYLKYHFGTEVNVTDLCEKHRSVYRVIDQMGSARSLITGWGFVVWYRRTMTEDVLIGKLREASVDGIVSLTRPLYNRVLYRARQKGISVTEYLDRIGLRQETFLSMDADQITRLKDEQGLSFRNIADCLGISKSAAHKHYKRSQTNDNSRHQSS